MRSLQELARGRDSFIGAFVVFAWFVDGFLGRPVCAEGAHFAPSVLFP
jgi:hypothetical protein